jgi:hypothetical protein
VEGGLVRGLLACPRGEVSAAEPGLEAVQAAGYAAGVDAEPRVLVHDSLATAVVNTATEARASLVVLGRSSTPGVSPFGSEGEAIAAGLPVPVALLVGRIARIREVEVVREADDRPGGTFDADGLAVDLARRIGGSEVEVVDLEPEVLGGPRPGQLRVLPATSWQLLAGAGEPAQDSATLILPDD